ncbi:MAG TPA: hypothetical protein VLX92_25610, partial [Kofleriaceae bacterium]|nr:hypothetical protein [Kofleriaceae bacterium]
MKEVLSYLLAFAGLIITAIVFVPTAGRLKYAAMRPMIIHMLRTSPHRAEIMCKAGKQTFLEPVGAALKTAAMMKSTDLALLGQASRPAFDAACTMVALHWKSQVKKARLGAMTSIGAIVLAIAAGANPALHIILGVLSLIGGIWVLVYKLDVEG